MGTSSWSELLSKKRVIKTLHSLNLVILGKAQQLIFSFRSKLGKTPYSRVLSLCHLEGVSDAMKGTDPLSDADRRIIEDLKLRIELKQLEVTRFFKFENNFLFRTKSSRKQD